MATDSTLKSETLHSRILSGSIVLLSGSSLTTILNLAYNIVVARFLGPKGFGHATAVYTILTLVSAVTLSFQIVSAKMVAQQALPENKATVYRGFHRSAWKCGLMIALLLVIFQRPIAAYLNLPDSTLVAILAVGAAFYVPLGTRRGYVQGTYGFLRLAVNLVSEGVIRLGGSLLLVHLGFGVRGVIIANVAAVACAYLILQPSLPSNSPIPIGFSAVLGDTSHALVFLAGQVLINNCDIVLVKHYFPAQMAGLYAAVAMVGRVIFVLSWAVVNTTFPLVAGTGREERRDLRVITTSLVLVLGLGLVLAGGLWLTPAWVWTASFGSGFQIEGFYNIPFLLTLYALTTVVYCLSVIIITFEMSYKRANTSWIQLAFSAVVILGICLFHSSLLTVIVVQLILMLILFVFVAIPFFIEALTDPKDQLRSLNNGPIKLLRRVSEEEVIAEFLKSDLHYREFEEFRESMRPLVTSPNLEDPEENAKRRALLFVRHLSLWNEIPSETEWYEAELNEKTLGNVRIFPRAHWVKLARGNFAVSAVSERVRASHRKAEAPFIAKINAIREQILRNDPTFGAVILIGVNECEPLTVLDGNHRLVAATIESPSGLPKLRFMCGLSPRMTECCWHNTNVVTLFRYGKNLLTHSRRNPEEELACLLQNAS